jgi:hypothetical protein
VLHIWRSNGLFYVVAYFRGDHVNIRNTTAHYPHQLMCAHSQCRQPQICHEFSKLWGPQFQFRLHRLCTTSIQTFPVFFFFFFRRLLNNFLFYRVRLLAPRPTPTPEDRTSVFISPRGRVATHFSRLLRHAWVTLPLKIKSLKGQMNLCHFVLTLCAMANSCLTRCTCLFIQQNHL